ncbi:MAG: DnaJ family molecular chaperone [Rhodobiaceae bacterium]|nr:DnaJ family molecular chaperone [Rhodobiaceae bacterium]MCC0055664.1 DnaJ family molecular chaperone [Rhodobiaceae bacterium]
MSVWSRIGDAFSRVVSGEAASRLIERLAGLAGAGGRQRDITFSLALIALSAKMARSDGVVTHHERDAFSQIFEVAPGDRAHVDRVFEMAERDVAGFDAYARQVARLFENERDTLTDVLDGLFHIAKADGIVHERELDYLERVASIFGFAEGEFAALRARHVLLADDPYAVLGLQRGISFREIRKHYRQLVQENHPDRLIARGVPEECRRIANDRLAAINAAYETIERELAR